MSSRVVWEKTSLVEHVVNVGDCPPICQKAYQIPYSKRDTVGKELDEMMKAGVTRPSVSPWEAPIVLVPKKDAGTRFCVGYQKLNSKASFNVYPCQGWKRCLRVWVQPSSSQPLT